MKGRHSICCDQVTKRELYLLHRGPAAQMQEVSMSLPTRARMTVSRGAAGNAIVMFISSICNRSTARRKSVTGREHEAKEPCITPHSEHLNSPNHTEDTYQ